MEMKVTRAYRETKKAFKKGKAKYIFHRGGTSSGKSISILQFLLIWGLENPEKIISIFSESMQKSKRGVQSDMRKIVAKEIWHQLTFNKTESVLYLPNGTEIRFLGAESEDKIIGMRSDISYFDEIDLFKNEVVEQVSIRTRIKVLASFNPRQKWELIEHLETRDDYMEIVTTYLDNPFLEESIIKDLLERAKHSLNFKQVYLDGMWGSIEGLIFKEDIGTGGDWQLISSMPVEGINAQHYGLDFGFVHKTASVHIKIIGNSVYIDEMLYKDDIVNSDIAREIKGFNPKNLKVVCDSAEPRAIAELRRTYGINTAPIKKLELKDSIQNWQEKQVFITAGSINLIKELRMWEYSKRKKDSKGNPKPIDKFDDAIAATRYAIDYYFKPKNKQQITIINF